MESSDRDTNAVSDPLRSRLTESDGIFMMNHRLRIGRPRYSGWCLLAASGGVTPLRRDWPLPVASNSPPHSDYNIVPYCLDNCH